MSGKSIFIFLLYLSRIVVGSLFIVSGMIKANDPLGFSYKMEEYFSEGALGWTIFEPYALAIGILICCSEIILGFAVLFGGKPKLTAWLLMIMIVFFSGLTYYTATCDPLATYKKKEMVTVQVDQTGKEINGEDIAAGKFSGKLTAKEVEKEVEKPVQCVTDCGCFGDALKGTIGRSLTPWESFYKDIILLFFILIIFIGSYAFGKKRKGLSSNRDYRYGLNSNRDDAIILTVSTISLILFSGYFFQWMFPVYFSLFCFAIYLLIKKYCRKYTWVDWCIAGAMTVISFGFAIYCVMYLPVKDFTAYAVGNNIREKLNDGIPAEYAIKVVYKNLKTGEEKTFDLNDKEWQDETKWKWVKTDNQIVKPGRAASIPLFEPTRPYEQLTKEEKNDPNVAAYLKKEFPKYYDRYLAIKTPYNYIDTIRPEDYDTATYPVSQYSIIREGEKLLDPSKKLEVNMIDYVLTSEKFILVVAKTLSAAREASMDNLKTLIEEAKKKKVPVYILTGSTQKDIDAFEGKNKFGVPYITMDETELKVVVRSNPGVLYLKKGVVAGKWPARSIPAFDELEK